MLVFGFELNTMCPYLYINNKNMNLIGIEVVSQQTIAVNRNKRKTKKCMIRWTLTAAKEVYLVNSLAHLFVFNETFVNHKLNIKVIDNEINCCNTFC